MRSKKKTEENVLILDIRNSSVGACLASVLPGVQPIIHYLYRKPVVFTKKQTTESFLKEMSDSLDATLEEVAEKGLRQASQDAPFSIDKVHCVYSSPWYVSHIRSFSVKKEEPFTFKKKHLDDIIEKENEFAEHYDEKLIGKSTKIEKQITHIELNGYITNDPFGKETSDVRASFYLALLSENTKKMIEKKVKRIFPRRKIAHHSFPLVAYRTIEDLFAIDPSYLIVDVGGEVTEVSTVYKNGLTQSFSFPYGHNSIVRDVADKCDMDFTETDSWLKMYVEGTADRSCKTKAKKVFSEKEKEWLKQFSKELKKNVPEDARPSHVFLMANSYMDDVIENALDKKVRGFKENFTIQRLRAKEMVELHLSTSGRQNDVFLPLEALFLSMESPIISV